jgi:hypothetical protein
MKYVFDLKGSLINREVKHPKPGNTLKDLNLLSIKVDENILKFTPWDKDHIMKMIALDVPMLSKANIMDYSLLLGIEENRKFRPPGSSNPSNPSQALS